MCELTLWLAKYLGYDEEYDEEYDESHLPEVIPDVSGEDRQEVCEGRKG